MVINYRGMGFDDLMVALQTVVAREGDKLTKQAVANVARYVYWFYSSRKGEGGGCLSQ